MEAKYVRGLVGWWRALQVAEREGGGGIFPHLLTECGLDSDVLSALFIE